MSSTMPSRLQIATRMHHLLMGDLGQGIDVEQMLRQERYARDVLLVCDAYKGGELALLAQQYRTSPPMGDDTMGRAVRPTDWSRNTSGFGVSRPMEILDPPQERRAVSPPSLSQRLVNRWRQR
jgi:hypothetical protein